MQATEAQSRYLSPPMTPPPGRSRPRLPSLTVEGSPPGSTSLSSPDSAVTIFSLDSVSRASTTHSGSSSQRSSVNVSPATTPPKGERRGKLGGKLVTGQLYFTYQIQPKVEPIQITVTKKPVTFRPWNWNSLPHNVVAKIMEFSGRSSERESNLGTLTTHRFSLTSKSSWLQTNIALWQKDARELNYFIRQNRLTAKQVPPLYCAAFEEAGRDGAVRSLDLQGIALDAHQAASNGLITFFKACVGAKEPEVLTWERLVTYFPHTTELNASGSSLTDACLEQIAKLRFLKTLIMRDNSKVTDKGIEHLAKRLNVLEVLDLGGCKNVSALSVSHISTMLQLKSLSLALCDISTPSLPLLSRLTRLKFLSFSGCKHLADPGLTRLFFELVNLKVVDLSDTNATDATVKVIGEKVKTITVLILKQTGVTNDSAPYLKEMRQLTTLDLSETQITTLCVQRLTGHAKLQHLKLRKVNITDQVMDTITTFPALQTLDISYTRISPQKSHASIMALKRRRVSITHLMPIPKRTKASQISPISDISEVSQLAEE